jgi:hypothetical protein
LNPYSGGQGSAIGNWRLDDDEGAGLHMNASGRVALMAKLGQAAGLAVPGTIHDIRRSEGVTLTIFSRTDFLKLSRNICQLTFS